jgi:hypothetical protein
MSVTRSAACIAVLRAIGRGRQFHPMLFGGRQDVCERDADAYASEAALSLLHDFSSHM